MRIIHTVPHVGHEASGPSYAVPRLCRALAQLGHRVHLMTLAGGADRTSGGLTHSLFPESGPPRRLGRSAALRKALDEAAKDTDLLHNHSLWMMPNIYPGWSARKAGKPLLISPRGTLTPYALSRSKVAKKLFWWLQQGQVVRQAVCLHASSPQEYQDFRRLGLAHPVCILPNGVDLGVAQTSSEGSDDRRVLLYLGRLHLQKGLDALIRAWREAAGAHGNWWLRIVGPDDGFEAQLRTLVEEEGVKRVEFAGPKYGEEKLREYRDADVYVLPTHSESFGMTIAEALANGTPVITTKGAPWPGLETERCGWWIEQGVRPLTEALREAMSIDAAERAAMGARGLEWMRKDYSWNFITLQMADVYTWVLGGGPLPGCVERSRSAGAPARADTTRRPLA